MVENNSIQYSEHEQIRYSRHLALPEIGVAGQQKIQRSKVLVVGAGGLGSPALLYLTAAGVGTIGVADFDVVDLSNLQRQILYSAEEIGTLKVDVVAGRLLSLNNNVKVVPIAERISAENVEQLVAQYDVVLDGTDNIATRFLLNDACVRFRKPYVYAAVFRFEGLASVLACQGGPCFRCMYPEPPADVPDPARTGVFGATAGTMGTIQATEAIKLIVGKGSSLVGRLLVYDALQMRFEVLHLQPNPACPLCSR